MQEGNTIWAHSGDSHFLEPEGLWQEILPANLATRMPWSEKIGDEEEIVHIDGLELRHPLPKLQKDSKGRPSMFDLSHRPPGARDVRARLADLDQEGIWGEVIYASLGLWESLIADRALIPAAAAAENEWKLAEVQGVAPDRLIAVGSRPMRDVEDAVAE